MITKKPFGKTADGEAVDLYTLTDGKISVNIITYGGAIQSILVPGKNGETVDVALGYDDVKGYQTHGGYIGALIGRIGNRIRNGEFELNGVKYHIFNNEKNASLHGGKNGFDKKVWNASVEGDKLVLTYLSKDGEENYPGNLSVKVTYSVENSSLKIVYDATTDKDTVLNLTNHCYFNLSGQGNGTAEDTILQIFADKITPMDENLLTDGRFMDVNGTVFDFNEGKAIGKDINSDDQQIKFGGGFDHNFVLNKKGNGLFAVAVSPRTNVKMECYTDQPGVQFYAGNFMGGTFGKGGKEYIKRGAFCLETQNYPNAVNCPEYPSCVLKPGEKYHTETVYKFSLEK